jgi:hypothetical protein
MSISCAAKKMSISSAVEKSQFRSHKTNLHVYLKLSMKDHFFVFKIKYEKGLIL